MVSSLAARLASVGWRVSICLPAYRSTLAEKPTIEVVARDQATRLGDAYRYDILRIKGNDNPRIYLIRCDALYDRGEIYGENGDAYSDNMLRYALLCEASLSLPRLLEERFDIVHSHDWHAALAPVLLSTAFATDPWVGDARSVLTIHNLAHQGRFDPDVLGQLGLPRGLYHPDFMKVGGAVNFLKGGIVFADQITTVSPSYAKEIQTPENGEGLHEVLVRRRDAMTGILNGIDDDLWDPASDPWIEQNYTARSLGKKSESKRALQKAIGLPVRKSTPLIGYVGRMVHQKGVDLIIESLEKLLRNDIQIVMLGTGDGYLEETLTQAAVLHPEKLAVRIGFDEKMAHRIEAGSDFFLMPSRFEPCGLNQLYSMRYGTIPIVHAVGGLSDTVKDASPKNIESGRATGVVFRTHSVLALRRAVEKALALYRDKKLWSALRRTAMGRDWSWQRSGRSYVRLYRSALKAGPRRLTVPDIVEPVAEAPSSDPYVDWGPELSPDYGVDTLLLLVQAPGKLFCYWEVTPETHRQAANAASVPESAPLSLVMKRVDREEEWPISQSIPLHGDWWLSIHSPGAAFVIEIRVTSPDGRHHTLLRSNRVRIPITGAHWRTDVTWARRPVSMGPGRPGRADRRTGDSENADRHRVPHPDQHPDERPDEHPDERSAGRPDERKGEPTRGDTTGIDPRRFRPEGLPSSPGVSSWVRPSSWGRS